VECGVWKGGSVLAMILALQRLGIDDREIWLYDTFEGMTEPTEHDTSTIDPPASTSWAAAAARGRRAYDHFFAPEVFGLAQVQALLAETGYPEHLIHFVAGPVEQTIPDRLPEQVAVLRLDTDWYESTRHELEYLYPRLASGGVLIIDDYGHWDGARKAVDEYLAEHDEVLLLHRTDYTGRSAVKG
jgi:O-methyltransferase